MIDDAGGEGMLFGTHDGCLQSLWLNILLRLQSRTIHGTLYLLADNAVTGLQTGDDLPIILKAATEFDQAQMQAAVAHEDTPVS